MSQNNKICLKPLCVLNVPIGAYEEDFTFIVNGQEYKTSCVVADLLSPVICKNHLIDRTMNSFIINTHTSGDFSQILKLINFETQTFQSSDIPFLTEVLEMLNNEFIEVENANKITIDNVFDLLRIHEKNKNFYSQNIQEEIEFIASHLYEICENYRSNMTKISIESLIRIFTNDELSLKSEDQLLDLINHLYKIDTKYSILYETVFFENVSNEMIHEFISIYNHNQMSNQIWIHLSKRLEYGIKIPMMTSNETNKNRYSQRLKASHNNKNLNLKSNQNDNEFNGILNFLRNSANGHLENEVNITASSTYTWSQLPRCVANFDSNQKNYFISNNIPNSWIKFEFKNVRVRTTGYTIKSRENLEFPHPKSWVIEGSNNDKEWEILDDEKNCPILNGSNVVHTFSMKYQSMKEFRFVRMRLTGKTWNNNDILSISSFELHGSIIE